MRVPRGRASATVIAALLLPSPSLTLSPPMAAPETVATEEGPDASSDAVLLTNDGTLPFTTGSVVVITAGTTSPGEPAQPPTLTGLLGDDASYVDLGPAVPAGLPGGVPIPQGQLLAIDGTTGLSAEYFSSIDLTGTPTRQVEPSPVIFLRNVEGAVAVRLSGHVAVPADGNYVLTLSATGTARLLVNGIEIIAVEPAEVRAGVVDPSATSEEPAPMSASVPLDLHAGESLELSVEQIDPASGEPLLALGLQMPDGAVSPGVANAIEAAGTADVAIIHIPELPGSEHPTAGALPYDHADLVRRVVRANPRTVVVLDATADPTLGTWVDEPAAVLHIPTGSGDLGSLVRLLRGDAQPMGDLSSALPSPLLPTPDLLALPQTPPRFEAGYGLTYWTYEMTGLHAEQVTIHSGDPPSATATLQVTATGTARGSTTVYLMAESPVRDQWLPVGSTTLDLAPAEVKIASIPLDLSDPALASPDAWPITLHAGTSPANLTLSTQLSAPESHTDDPVARPPAPQGAVRRPATGALTLTIDGEAAQLGNARQLGDRLQLTGQLPVVTVIDTRENLGPGAGWTVVAHVSDLTGQTGALSASDLGWIPRLVEPSEQVLAGPSVPGRLSGGPGLAEPAVLGQTSGDARRGPVRFGADLILETPRSTAPGIYRGTLTVTLFPID